MIKVVLFLTVLYGAHGLLGSPRTQVSFASKSTKLQVLPKPGEPLFKGPKYQQTVEQLMFMNGLTEEEAKAEYNAYLENPNNYALAKGEAYYQKLGYKSLMEGVIGEAEKEGRGDEVRERIEAFKRKSQLKAYSVIGTAIIVLFAYKISYDIDPTLFM